MIYVIEILSKQRQPGILFILRWTFSVYGCGVRENYNIEFLWVWLIIPWCPLRGKVIWDIKSVKQLHGTSGLLFSITDWSLDRSYRNLPFPFTAINEQFFIFYSLYVIYRTIYFHNLINILNNFCFLLTIWRFDQEKTYVYLKNYQLVDRQTAPIGLSPKELQTQNTNK